ncbi:MAG: dihydrolipoyl dehydrogenase [Planctomycetota bacterium]|nr:dihydrolipoyl dehydrogenase [Planctomycetota bacterium]
MMTFDLIVIGAGPGGYVASIRAAQLGLNVACIEKNNSPGGTCLRVGCIPSKALLESSEKFAELVNGIEEHGIELGGVGLNLHRMMERKERIVKTLSMGVNGLLRKNKVKYFHGTARLDGPGKVIVTGASGETAINANRIILATGSRPAFLPGVEPDGQRIGTSYEALAYDEVPHRLIVIGAGYIGMELGSVWSRLGSEVTVLEYLDRILPGMDIDLSEDARKIFEKQGMKFDLGCRVTGARTEEDEVIVEREGRDPMTADRVLLAVGRKANTEGINLESARIEKNERGQIEVDDHFQTTAEKVYAIGDVIRGPMLAHKAEEEGIACVEQFVNGYGHVNYNAIPGIVYTHPEIASVGKTEEQLQEEHVAYEKGEFPFAANGRARALGCTDGKVKILADRETDRILGAHIIGPRAGDLIAEAAIAIEFSASAEDLARSIHAHPTLAEAVKEAALAVGERAIHS